MQLIMQLLARPKPQIMKSMANSKDPMFGEVVLPGRLRNFPADLSPMGSFLKPNQMVSNYVNLELARGKFQTPSYTPYIAADLSAPPWPVPSAEHTADVAKWKTNNQASKPGAQPLPFHAWAPYRFRFMIAADLCAAWTPFGGLAARPNNVAIILNLAATESISVALAYDSILSAHLGELSRADRVSGAVDFADLLSSGKQRFKIHAISQAAKSAPRPAVPKVATKAVTEVPKATDKRP